MSQHRYSWLVFFYDTTVYQVDADELIVTPSGHHVFCNYTEKDDNGFGIVGSNTYVVMSLPGSSIRQCAIMSQITGYQNGYQYLRGPDEKNNGA